MKPTLALLPLALAGCTMDAPPASLGGFEYGAISHDPFWLVSIGGDRIMLTMGPAGGRADGELESYEYPRVLPKTDGEVRRWESGRGTQVIAVEARPGPCTTGGRTYPDRAKVFLSGRVMEGCGGPELTDRSRG